MGCIIPPLNDQGRFHRSAGVFDADGGFIHLANVRRGDRLEIQPRQAPAMPEAMLKGRHLYGGQLNHHFGHFLCESLARLWALAEAGEPVESILLLPRRSGSEREFRGFHQQAFRLLGLTVPVRIVEEPMRVEELIVPAQDFGIGDMAAGTPRFIRYMRHSFAPDVAPDGPEHLYVSREGLSLLTGSIIGEETLSRNLAKSGYVEFRPEEHDLRTQIARYKAARRIVSVEGSALHLYGFVAHPAQKVAIIARRSDHVAARAIAAQIRAFGGAEATIFDGIRREWDTHDAFERSSKSVTEIDFPALARQLGDAGFIEERDWKNLHCNVERRVARIAGRTGRAYRLITASARAQAEVVS